MSNTSHPHIKKLRSLLKVAYSEAKYQAEIKYATQDDGCEEKVWLLVSREFTAAYQLLDEMVENDRFTTLGNLIQARDALNRYRLMLLEDGYQLRARQIWDIIKEIDAVRVEQFSS